MHNTNRPSLWTRISALFPYVLLTIMLASSMIPLVSMLGTSFRTKETLMTTSSLIPPVPSLHFYRNVLSNPRIAGYFRNSFVISSITCLITATISIFGGYAMARFRNRVKGVGFFTLFVILVQMFPTIQMVIPLYTTFNSLGILNKSYTLLFAYPAFMLPMNLMMMQSFIEGVPYEMEEAGRIDGCSRMQVIIKLVLPMGRPIQPVQTKLYVAYGSNLNVQQMSVRCPDAEIEGTTRLDNYKLMFQGRSGGAVATVIPALGSHVLVLLWRITPEDEWALDRYEGWPTLYRKETAMVRHCGRAVEAMIYIMNEGRPYGQPGQGYLNTIREGYHAAKFDVGILRKAVTDSTRLSFKGL